MGQDITSERIRTTREERRMSLRDLSEKTGFSTSVLSRYERGYIEKLSCDRLAIIATALNVSPVWLMGFDEEPEEQPNAYTLDPVERFIIDTYRQSDGRQKARMTATANEIADEIEKNNLQQNGTRAIG